MEEATVIEWGEFWSDAILSPTAAPVFIECPAAYDAALSVLTLAETHVADIDPPPLSDILIHSCDTILVHMDVHHGVKWVRAGYPKIEAAIEGARKRMIESWT